MPDPFHRKVTENPVRVCPGRIAPDPLALKKSTTQGLGSGSSNTSAVQPEGPAALPENPTELLKSVLSPRKTTPLSGSLSKKTRSSITDGVTALLVRL